MKRYYRSEKDNLLGGVCGGFGEYFNIDPLFIRLLFIGLVLLLPKLDSSFITDSTIIGFYLIMWFAATNRPKETVIEIKEDEQDTETGSTK
jgi:phage shock protein C